LQAGADAHEYKETPMQVDLNTVEYAGFGSRFLAAVLDSIIQVLLLAPIMLWLFGPQFLTDPEVTNTPFGYTINYGLPLLYVVLCWKYKSATPGKYMMGMSIVDAATGGRVPMGRLVLRYLGYYVCIFTLFIGFFWIIFDKRKQGFHDKIAGTVVIINPSRPSGDM
jgi:uncharacterized RDD family membrane protein YckC